MRPKMFWVTASITALLLGFGAAPAHADVDDYSYDSWTSHYELDLDHNGQAVARVTETLTPVFPESDQNRGIVRALPLRYEGAPSAPEQISVVDGQGELVPFWTEDDDTFRVILVGDDSFVHGRQEYVISYTLHDVIVQASETQADEFYWDILPLNRKQPIAEFSATVSLSPGLSTAFTGNAACYFGHSNSTDRCQISPSDQANSLVDVPTMKLDGGEGVTIALGFAPGTVQQPDERLPSFALDVAPATLAGIAALSSGVGVSLIARLRRKRRTFRGTIVAQYDVPPYLPPLIAGPLTGASGSAVVSEFIHLSVAGAMRIEEPPADSKKRKAKEKSFRLIDAARAHDPLDQGMLRDLFPGLSQNSVFTLPKASTSFSTAMQSQAAAGVKAAKERRYFTRESSRAARALGICSLAFVLIAILLLMVGSSREPTAGLFVAWVFIVIGVITAMVSLSPHKVHTPLGAESYEYLEGVREFIRVAEAERFAMLQSYTGADRLESGEVNVVHIYEKLLPYAVLFGQEKEWGRALQTQYEQQGVHTPYWYPGVLLHSSNLGNSLASFSSSAASSASYTSSSSGGSSGGGFSGGGGGGGFSGGR